jgi:hypothetical protein
MCIASSEIIFIKLPLNPDVIQIEFLESGVNKFGFLLVIALLAIEFGAMNFAYANKTKNSFSAFTRITNPIQTDSLGNVIFKPY